MKTIFPVLAALCLAGTGFGQKITPLSVGDTVPDIVLNNIVNYKTTSAKLSDFKGRLLVLDFWDTWCTACINTFPHNNEIQHFYGSKIQILNVGFQPESKIRPFLQSLEKRLGAGYRITTVTGDTLLQQLFPHRFIPHLVWIGPDRVVKAITSSTQLTKENIGKILKGQPAGFQQKKDIVLDKPSFLPSAITGPPFNMIHYSLLVIGGVYDGASVGQHIFKQAGKTYGCNYTNRTLYNICFLLGRGLWNNHHYQAVFDEKRYKIEIKDPARLRSFKKDTWQFSFFVPKNSCDPFYEKALREIGNYTGFSASLEVRNSPCLILKKTDAADKLATKGGKPYNDLFSTANSAVTNLPFKVFFNFLEQSDIGLTPKNWRQI
ncbi:MAG TPA: TlpA disulfide reductase family protein [Arachidicoccus soli]|nr:TlpA disulfide reductase family protein [Arachidicoccus soli]